jgi:hypothetical protein
MLATWYGLFAIMGWIIVDLYMMMKSRQSTMKGMDIYLMIGLDKKSPPRTTR